MDVWAFLMVCRLGSVACIPLFNLQQHVQIFATPEACMETAALLTVAPDEVLRCQVVRQQ